MVTSETDAAMQIRFPQTDGKLLRAIEDAVTRIPTINLASAQNAGNRLARRA